MNEQMIASRTMTKKTDHKEKAIRMTRPVILSLSFFLIGCGNASKSVQTEPVTLTSEHHPEAPVVRGAYSNDQPVTIKAAYRDPLASKAVNRDVSASRYTPTSSIGED